MSTFSIHVLLLYTVNVMDTYVGLLEGYHSRDNILRTISYAAGFASGAFKGKFAKDLIIIANQVSSARTVNRLLDDVLMWRETSDWGSSVSIRRNDLSFSNYKILISVTYILSVSISFAKLVIQLVKRLVLIFAYI